MTTYALQRAISIINRFGGLRRAERIFRAVQSPAIVTRRLFGHRMVLDIGRSSAQQLLLLEGERFVEERHLLRRLLRPGMTVVDVGANIGYYVLLFESVIGPRGRIIAVEPSTENLPELTQTIEANGFDNVILHPVALGAESGTVGLRTGINSGVDQAADAHYHVRIARLDELVEERVDLLKIDVEGYEGQVLDGCASILEKHRPVIFLELHPNMLEAFGRSTSEILGHLSNYYRSITLYDKRRPHEQSVLLKVLTRYCGRDPLRRVVNVSEYVRALRGKPADYTFWAVCQP